MTSLPVGWVSSLVDDSQSQHLRLLILTPQVRKGQSIEALIDADNVLETIVTLEAMDRIAISSPRTVRVGSGTCQETVSWIVDSVQQGTSNWVEITVTARQLVQKGMCRVVR